MEERSTLTDLEPVSQHRQLAVPYSPELSESICEAYTQGLSLTAICRMPGMPPYHSVTNWLRNVPGFREAIDQARAARGIILEDMILADINTDFDKDEVPSARLRFDKLRWATEVNDPARYGKKVTHAGDASRPIQFVISTGFPEPNEFQRPPKLDAGGLIIKEVRHEPRDKGQDEVEREQSGASGLELCESEAPEGGTGMSQGSV